MERRRSLLINDRYREERFVFSSGKGNCGWFDDSIGRIRRNLWASWYITEIVSVEEMLNLSLIIDTWNIWRIRRRNKIDFLDFWRNYGEFRLFWKRIMDFLYKQDKKSNCKVIFEQWKLSKVDGRERLWICLSQ